MAAIKWIVLIVLISIPNVVHGMLSNLDEIDDEPGVAAKPIPEPPKSNYLLQSYRSGQRAAPILIPMGLKLGFRPDYRTELLRNLDEIHNLLNQFRPSNTEMKTRIESMLANLVQYLNKHKNEIFGLSNPEDIVVFMNIMKVIWRSKEVNVLNIDLREIIKKTVGKIVSFVPDARAIELTLVFCGTFGELFSLSEMLESNTFKQNDADKLIRSISTSIGVFTSDFPDLGYTPDITDKLAQLRVKLNEEEEEEEQREVHEGLNSRQPTSPVNHRQELLKLLQSLPLTESIDRVLADNASIAGRMAYYNSEILWNAFITVMPLASIKNYTTNTITRILLKDLTWERNHHIANKDRDEQIDYLLTRLVDAPDGRTSYKFQEHRELVEAVNEKLGQLSFSVLSMTEKCQQSTSTTATITSSIPVIDKVNFYAKYVAFFYGTIDMQKLLYGAIKKKNCEIEINQHLKTGLDFNIKIDNLLRDIREDPQSSKIWLKLKVIQKELTTAESAETSSKLSLSPQFARELAKVERMKQMDRSNDIQSSVEYHKQYV